MSQETYNYVQLLARKKYLHYEKQFEGQVNKVVESLNQNLLNSINNYTLGDGSFNPKRLPNLKKDINLYSRLYHKNLTKLMNEGILNSAAIAMNSQDLAARAHIREVIKTYPVKTQNILNRALLDPKGPFLLSTKYGAGLPKAIAGISWNHRWNDGYNLSDRIWKHTDQLRENLHGMIEKAVNEGHSAVNFSRAVEQYLKEPGPKWTTAIRPAVTDRGSIKYNALRLARTETNQAYQRCQKLSAQKSPLVKGVKWNLSASHPLDWPPSAAYEGYAEICEYNAENDHVGLGPGVFYPDQVPSDHPNGLCYLTDVLLSNQELQRYLEQEYGKIEWAEEKTGPRQPVEFKAAKTVKQAEKWARDNDLADNISYKGLHVDTANEINKSVNEHLNKYPHLREHLKFIGSAQEQEKFVANVIRETYIKTVMSDKPHLTREQAEAWAKRQVKVRKVPGTAYAQAYQGNDIRGIGVNNKWGSDPGMFVQHTQLDIKTNWHPPGTGSIKGIVDHEMGHIIDFAHNIKGNDPIFNLYSKLGDSGIKEGLSRYGAVNFSEFIAEAWAEYVNNPKPRAIASQVGGIMDKILRGVK